MFAGQGAHYRQMGRELYESVPLFREHLLRLDEVARPMLGTSVVAAIYDRKFARGDQWDTLALTHPAIFMVQIALMKVLAARGIEPDIVLGTSLGTYIAAAAAGCMSDEHMLRFVISQAKSIERFCPTGGMLAVLAPVDMYARCPQLSQNAELAGTSFDAHFVLSGSVAGLDAAESFLKSQGITHQRLAVSYAFHSRAIDGAQSAFKASFGELPLRAAAIPIACCAQARLIDAFTADAAWQVARGPIRFRDMIRVLEAAGPHRYIDLSPSATLASFARYNLIPQSKSQVQAVLSPFGRDLAGLEKIQPSTATLASSR
jgi:acyl transferase domain-containing protein